MSQFKFYDYDHQQFSKELFVWSVSPNTIQPFPTLHISLILCREINIIVQERGSKHRDKSHSEK